VAEWKLGYHNGQDRQKVDREKRQVVMSVMGAEKEEADRYRQEKLLGGGVLIPIINLLPQVQIVICSGVEVKRHASHVVEHQV